MESLNILEKFHITWSHDIDCSHIDEVKWTYVRSNKSDWENLIKINERKLAAVS
jgi:hypothetical protein